MAAVHGLPADRAGDAGCRLEVDRMRPGPSPAARVSTWPRLLARPAGSRRAEADRMTMTALDSPLLRMTQETPTQYWNDSCAVDELAYAVERGATGATSNPSIVLDVMKKEKAHWVAAGSRARRREPDVDRGGADLGDRRGDGGPRARRCSCPSSSGPGGRHGRLSVQTNPANHRDPARMVEQAVRFAGLAPNIQVKFPATAAGIVAIEEATFRGVNINATVSFTVPQALAAAEAVERGLDRRAAAGQ